MRIPFDHPIHEFYETGIESLPSITGEKTCVYRCRNCGIMGTKSGKWVYLSGSAHRVRELATACTSKAAVFKGKYVRIIVEDLHERGEEYSCLTKGKVAPLFATNEAGMAEGVMIEADGRQVTIKPGEYQIIKARYRERTKG